jgi:hypothetical protein
MADTTIVTTQVATNPGQSTPEIVTFSDEKNNSFSIVGIPGGYYNLNFIPSNGVTPIISAVEVTSTVDSQISFLFNTSIQEPQPQQLVSFTDNQQNTISVLGSPNTIYDLNVLTYLLAVVSALDTFMTMGMGDAYENYKHERLQLVNLE